MEHPAYPLASIRLETAESTQRALSALRNLVDDAAVGHAEIENRVGYSRGYLTQILGGYVELRLDHVLTILDSLSASPERFFASLFPSWPRHSSRLRSDRRRRLRASLDVAIVYVHGLESVQDLRLRLERCEQTLIGLARGQKGALRTK